MEWVVTNLGGPLVRFGTCGLGFVLNLSLKCERQRVKFTEKVVNFKIIPYLV